MDSGKRAVENRRSNIIGIQKHKEGERIAATAFQEALFLKQIANPSDITSNILLTYEITNCDKQTLFLDCVKKAYFRHEIYRTYFELEEDRVLLKFATTIELDLNITDLSSIEPSKQQENIQEFALKIAHEPFDLEKRPPFRVKLFRVSDTTIILVRVVHHIISDEASNNIFINDICDAYAAEMDGSSPQAKQRLRFSDYAAWESGPTQSALDRREKQSDFWSNLMNGSKYMIRWPIDFQRPPEVGSDFRAEGISLSPELWSNLNKLAKASNASNFQFILTVLTVFIYRLTEENDFSIAFNADLRRPYGISAEIAGPIVNALPVRFKIDSAASFNMTLKEVCSLTIRAYMNSEVGYDKVISFADGKRESTSVCYFYENKNWTSGTLKFRELYLDSGGGEWDLIFQFRETKGTLNLSIRYNAELFLKETIKTMLKHLNEYCEQIAVNPLINICELPKVKKAEERINDTYANYQSRASEEQQISPRNSFETYVARTFKKITASDKVFVFDNFFEIGGTLEMVGELVKLLKQDQYFVNLREICENPTVLKLAIYLEKIAKKRAA